MTPLPLSMTKQNPIYSAPVLGNWDQRPNLTKISGLKLAQGRGQEGWGQETGDLGEKENKQDNRIEKERGQV